VAIAPGKADLVLHEGCVLGHPGSDSIAIAGGVISGLGPYAELKSQVGPRTHLVKLAGRVVSPGFIDSHIHFLEGASAATGISLQRCRSVGDLLAALRIAAGKSPPGNWLRAFGCDEAMMFEKRGPTRAELDHSLPKNPLRLRHQTLNGSWLNSRAIKLLGLEGPDFQPPAGAEMFREPTGALTGLVVGMESWLTERLPLVTRAEAESRARVMSRELASAGVTAFTDATARNGVAEVELFARFAQSGSVSQRIGIMIGGQNLDSAAQCEKLARDGGIRLAGVKFKPGYPYDPAGLSRPVRLALERGLDCAFHATEVEELEEAVAALESAKTQFSGEQDLPNFRIEHGGVIPSDYIDRIAALGAWVVTNPGFVHFRGPKYAEEPGLFPFLYRARTLKAAGIKLAGASDAPVTPAKPLLAIAAAVSRLTIDGQPLGSREGLSTADAFALFTSEAARLSHLDAGEIAPNRLADLIVLPRDPLSLNPADLMNLAVDITIIAGRVVYERGRPAIASSDSADLHSG
jgi:predicted amidohydrolase YtcJ